MKAIRLDNNPIITPDMLPGDERPNVNGPALIRVPRWVKNPLGRYYLYFAHHNGLYIRLAYADRLEGPWRIHEPGTLHLDNAFFKNHVASPDVHVDDAKQEIRMYYHGPIGKGVTLPPRWAQLLQDNNQGSRLALSKDGINFTALEEIIGGPYLRVFRHGDFYYAIAKPGTFYRSRDGMMNFELGPTLSTPKMRHPAVKVDGNTLTLFYSNIGDHPERIVASTVDLTPDWKQWRASEPATVLSPEKDYEGADMPLIPSRGGKMFERVHQLRDPGIFQEEGKTYLLYSVAGEYGLAVAELTW